MWAAVVGLTVLAYLVNMVVLRYVLTNWFYIASIAVWFAVALAIFFIGKSSKKVNLITLRKDKSVIVGSCFIAILQIMTLVSTGFIFGFGRNPLSYTPYSVAINILYFVAPLLAIELARNYIAFNFKKKYTSISIVSLALLFTIVLINPYTVLTLIDALTIIKFIGATFIPIFTMNVFATLLVIFGGAIASTSYMGLVRGFIWIAPILPNPDWAVTSMVNTVIPILGFVIISQNLGNIKLLRLGFLERRRQLKSGYQKKNSSWFWIACAIFVLFIVWVPTGLLGIKPSVVVSSSMSPTIETGDMIFTVKIPLEDVKIGDVIQYMRQGSTTLITHRVIDIDERGDSLVITTKGDANNIADPPIIGVGVVEKMIYVVPKVGWATIYMRAGLGGLAEYFSSNLIPALLGAITIISLISAIAFRQSRKSSWRGRF